MQRVAAATGAELQALLRATEERQAQPFKLDVSAIGAQKSETEREG
jgi:hypothetical protein